MTGTKIAERSKVFTLSLQKVSLSFGGIHALRDISYTHQSGEIVGIIGPNGSGKSTLLNVITGVYRPSAGLLHLETSAKSLAKGFRGFALPRPSADLAHLEMADSIVDLVRCSREDIVRAGIARTFQKSRLFTSLTVEEHLTLARSARQPHGGFLNLFPHRPITSKCERDWLDYVGLAGDRNTSPQALPYGKRRLLEIARCLETQPRLLLLDEPTAGLNEAETMQVCALLQRVSRDLGIGLLVIEHDIAFIRRLCPRLVVMNGGNIFMQGATETILNDFAVIQLYLGEQ